MLLKLCNILYTVNLWTFSNSLNEIILLLVSNSFKVEYFNQKRIFLLTCILIVGFRGEGDGLG